jgi:uncharacterized damage-inducible protein DinB
LSARAYYGELSTTLAALDEPALQRPIRVPGLRQYEERMRRRFDDPTLGQTMLQVVTHSAHHRGQVNARLREIGAEPPLVDYIAWVWFARPAPEWP